MKLTIFFVAILLYLISVCTAEEEEHDHEWEWVGIFDVHADDQYFWSAEKVDSEYADARMKILWLQVPSADEVGIEAVEEMAEEAFEDGEPLVVTADNATMRADGSLYELVFDENSWITIFKVTFPNDEYWAAFTEHVPSEFEDSVHYLRDADGNDVEPEFEQSEHEDDGDEDDDNISKQLRIRITVGACFVVWLCTFAGLVTLVNSKILASDKFHKAVLLGKMFAAGALMSTAFSLVLSEAIHLIEERNSDIEEGEVAGYWTAMVLVGFVTPLIVSILTELIADYLYPAGVMVQPALIVPPPEEDDVNESGASGVEMIPVEPAEKSDEGENNEAANAGQRAVVDADECNLACSRKFRIVSGVLVGDFMHNFADGIFIGAAFKSCSVSTGWTIAAATVFHELSQEIADFIVLTGTAGFSVLPALGYNFISGASVLIGGLVIAYSSVSDFNVGMLLAYGAGQYLYLAAVELMPDMLEEEEISPKTGQSERRPVKAIMRIACLISFAIGAVAVGLVLLDHEHCDASHDHGDSSSDTDSGDSHGHNHF